MNCIEADNVIDINSNRKMKMSQEVIENLIAQLEASKQMYNDALNNLYQARTQAVMLQRQMQAVNNRLAELEKAHASEVDAKSAEVNPTPSVQEIDCGAPTICEDYSDKSPETDVA